MGTAVTIINAVLDSYPHLLIVSLLNHIGSQERHHIAKEPNDG